MKKDEVLAFLKQRKHAVISTCGKNDQPEAALIGFGETDNFELIFGTYTTSRKYQNLKENNKVAFVISDEEEFITVQYEGVAQEIFGDELEKYVSIYHKKVPGATKYRSLPNQSYWKVQPTWMRYSDLSNEDNEIIEEFRF